MDYLKEEYLRQPTGIKNCKVLIRYVDYCEVVVVKCTQPTDRVDKLKR